MAGGKCVGIPLKPRNSVKNCLIQQSKTQLKERCKGNFKSGQEDEWDIDFEKFEKAINPKTKVLLLNSPHNPVGKVFTQEEL